MLEKSFGLLFFLKQPKNQENTSRYVYLRITVDGVSKELSTKRSWDLYRWNQSTGRATGTKEDARGLNAYLDGLALKVFQAKSSLIEKGKHITAESIKNFIAGKDEEFKPVLVAFKEHNENMKLLLDRDFAPGTLQRYETSLNHTKSFIKWKYNKDDISFSELDYDFISSYALWLKAIRNCNHNSAMKYLVNFKKIVNDAINKGWLLRDPFIKFSTARKPVARVALTKEELQSIKSKELHTDRLNHVRDMFLFSCYTGLSYIDLKQLQRNQIIIGVDGEQWIITSRQKTDSPTRLPLLPVAKEIMERYKEEQKCKHQGLVLPVLSNQKMNSYLKEIADLCGLNKNLTFHIARHTFATTVTLSNGVPIETVSKMLGHSSLKQTQLYAKILDLKVSEDMAVLKTKLI